MGVDNNNPGEAEGRIEVDIDGKKFEVRRRTLSGREVLELAGKEAADNYLVFYLNDRHVLQDLGSGHLVELHPHRVARFFTFKSDRSYRFELNGKREDWGAPIITGATLLRIAGVGEEFEVYQELKDGKEKLIEPTDFVDLAAPGIEKFFTKKIVVTVWNEDSGKDFLIDAKRHTLISTIIERIYEHFKVPKLPDDRLRCEQAPGEDVFQFASLTMDEYLEKGHCKCLIWLFTGGTGGASCQ